MLEGKKTYIGLLVAAIPTLAGFFGYNISPESAGELGGIIGAVIENIEQIVTSAGLLFAWYGRKVTKA